MPEAQAISYDEVPYESQAFHESHPDNLAAIGRLYGLNPAAPSCARILEIGCASGGNLIPIAVERPEARLIGIDLSERQIGQGLALIERLGLGNIQLEVRNLSALPEDIESFDYIIAHGVYSWIPAPLQAQLLEVCARRLKPQGVAYVSYNTYPGWHVLGMLREMMLFHVASEPDAIRRLARARQLLDDLAASVEGTSTPYAQAILREVARLRTKRDSYILHEYLEEHNEPVYFEQFVERAQRQGLKPFADARFRTTSTVGPGVAHDTTGLERLGGTNTIRREQYRDFQHNRAFRRSLLTHASSLTHELPEPGALLALTAVSAAPPALPVPDIYGSGREEFRGHSDSSRFTTSNPLVKSALVRLQNVWPEGIPGQRWHDLTMAELDRRPAGSPAPAFDRSPEAFAAEVWGAYLAGIFDLHLERSAANFEPIAKPTGSPYARIQAEASDEVTNLQHRTVRLTPFERLVLRACDGECDREALAEQLALRVLAGEFPISREGRPLTDPAAIREILSRSVPPCLARLRNAALFRA